MFIYIHFRAINIKALLLQSPPHKYPLAPGQAWVGTNNLDPCLTQRHLPVLLLRVADFALKITYPEAVSCATGDTSTTL